MEPITEDTYCIRSLEDIKLVRETLLLNADPDTISCEEPIEFPCIVHLRYSEEGGSYTGWAEYTYQSDIELFLSYLTRNGDET